MLKRFQDLNVADKLAIIIITMAIPVVATITLLWRQAGVRVTSTQNEIRGLTHLQPLDALLEHLNEHRALTFAVLHGAKEEGRRVGAVAPQVDKDFAAVDAMVAGQNDTYGLSPALAGLKDKWQAIKRQGFNASAEDSMARHAELSDDVRALIRTIGDRSELVLDPVVPGYYLADISVVKLPEVIENLSRLRAYDLEAHLTPMALADRAAAVNEAKKLREDFASLRRDFAVAKSADASLGPLAAAEEAALQVAAKYLSRFDGFEREAVRRVAAPGVVGSLGTLAAAGPTTGSTQPGVSPASPQTAEQVLQEGEAAIRAFVTLHDATQAALERLLTARAAAVSRQRYLEAGIGLVGLLMSIGISFWVVRSITRPVKDMMGLFSAIGMGDFKARAEAPGDDEMGTLAKSLNAMLDNIMGLMQSRDERDQMQQSIRKLLEDVSGVGEGDLTAEAEVTADMTGAIADSFNQMIGELRKVIGQVQGATMRVSMSAQQLQQTTAALAEGSEKQAAQIIDTSAAVEEMAASISQVSENASSSAAVAEQSRANAEQGAKAVTRTIEGMGSIRNQVQETAKRIKRLGESSQEVGEIVQLIGDIADRTSILALNASIQAAMAGEAGRGFAVVAEEVERLADRATEATKRISTLIKTTQSETAEAVAAMEDTTREVVKGSALANEAGVALTEIKTVSDRLADLIQAISDASQQQSKGSEQVAKAMNEISDHTRKTAAVTKDTAVSIGSLAALSSELNNSMARFKLPKSHGHGRAA